MKIYFVLLSLVLQGILQTCDGARIFFLIPLTSKSEKVLYEPLIDELSLRGHEVVVASCVKSKYQSKTIREFYPITYEQYVGDEISDPIEARKEIGRYATLAWDFVEFTVKPCNIVYKNEEFMKVIKNEKFDLVFRNTFGGNCFNGAVYRIGAPWINVDTFLPIADPWEYTGARIPGSFVPFAMGPPRSYGKMSFLERLENVLLDVHYQLLQHWVIDAAATELYRKYLGQDIPDAQEINYNVSLVFSNSHFTLNAPAPVLPDVIEIGGMQNRPAKPLPKDLDDFLSGADEHGFIYFSMGSMLNSKHFPEHLRKTFLSVFSKLKQRVLWKFEADADNLPPNVKIGKWLPQRDILAHPKIRLFITHGGALSTQEAIYSGVPLIAIPIFADQDGNAQRAAFRGFAIKLEALELSEATINNAIQEILRNPSYTNTVKDVQKFYKDQPMPPLDRALYWTEYVIRHKGTKHLQSSARQLNFVEYYLLDVISLLVVALLFVLAVIVLILRSICRLVFKRDQKVTQSKKNK